MNGHVAPRKRPALHQAKEANKAGEEFRHDLQDARDFSFEADSRAGRGARGVVGRN